MSKRLKNKVIVVAGAGGGVGSAVTRTLAAEGARVLAADIDKDRVRKVGAEIQAAGGEISSAELDVTCETSWARLAERVLDQYGQLDGLVNSACQFLSAPLEETSLEAFQQLNDVNVHGVFLGTKTAVMTMRRCAGENTPKGSIVNVSSTLATVGQVGATAFCTGQGAVRILTKSIAVECGQRRDEIRVNSVHPGWIRTPAHEARTPAEFWDEDGFVSRSVPLASAGHPDDVAEAVAFLASDESRLMTGAEITVDGGWSIQ